MKLRKRIKERVLKMKHKKLRPSLTVSLIKKNAEVLERVRKIEDFIKMTRI